MHDPGTPYLATDPFDWAGLLALIHRAFAGMHDRIDPPSSLHHLTPARLAAEPEVWVLGEPALACMVLTPRPGHLYLGKLAVEPAVQGHGLGRRMLVHAAERARALHLPRIELETRVELIENHHFYHAMGYTEMGRRAHPGYSAPTAIRYVKQV